MPETSAEPTHVSIVPPSGLDEIRSTFGDIFQYILSDHTLDPRWQPEFLTRIELLFKLPLSWDKSRVVDHITCHKLIAVSFTQVFAEIKNAGLQDKITTFGGCFAFRPQRTGTKLSAHAWGIAIDLNPESNAQGTAGSIDAAVVAIFKQAGFTWGGDWKGRSRDPMYFQFCTGY